MSDTREYAKKLLDQLIRLDKEVQDAKYEMGRILSAIAHGQLYDLLGYNSLGALIDEELSFARGSGFKYLSTFRHFRRLHYTKTEALDLIHKHSFTKVSSVLPSIESKISATAISRRIASIDKVQINFTLTKSQHALLEAWLFEYGAEKGEDGRLENSSKALMAMLGEETSEAA